MNRLSVFILLILVAGLASCTTQEKAAVQEKETVNDSGAESFQPEPLDDEWSQWLVGKWKVVSGESDFLGGDELIGVGEPNEEAAGGFTIEFALNGQFLIWESWAEGEMTDEQKKQVKEAFKETTKVSDEDLERFLSMPFKELVIQTVDPKTGERIGYLFDSQRCIAKGRGRLEGNKEIMEWQWSGTGQGATSVSIIERINDDTFAATHKYALPDGNEMEEKIEMIRTE